MVGRRQHSVNEKLGGEGNDMADDLPPWEQRGALSRNCEPHREDLLLWLGHANSTNSP
jgi:hypothetical protein